MPPARRRALLGLALVGLGAGLAWRLARFERFAVVGDSMAPALLPGDRLLVRRLRRGRWPQPGDVVVAADPRQPERALLKRVASTGGGRVWLAGDSPGRSTDSRDFGPVPLSALSGKAVYRYAPASRAGRLRPQVPREQRTDSA